MIKEQQSRKNKQRRKNIKTGSQWAAVPHEVVGTAPGADSLEVTGWWLGESGGTTLSHSCGHSSKPEHGVNARHTWEIS